jgi:hypothetical protein
MKVGILNFMTVPLVTCGVGRGLRKGGEMVVVIRLTGVGVGDAGVGVGGVGAGMSVGGVRVSRVSRVRRVIVPQYRQGSRRKQA